MVKAYLRYRLSDSFGTINTSSCKSISLIASDYLATGTNEVVSLSKCRTGDVKCQLKCTDDDYTTQSLVTCFIYSHLNEKLIYVGYNNGSIRRFNINEPKHTIYDDFCFNGHKSSVTCLALSSCGALLASGSQDCDVVIWSAFGDSSLFRLQGHRNEVTALRFLSYRKARVERTDELLGFLVSTSKDCIIRIWDLSSQLCIQTIIDSTGELYTLNTNSDETRLYVGGVESVIRYYSLDMSGEACEDSLYSVPVYCRELPSIPSQRGKCTNISPLYEFDGFVDQRGLLLSTVGKFVQLYRLYDRDEAAKRRDKRLKRIAEKKKLKCKKLREILKATGYKVARSFNNIDEEIQELEVLLKGKAGTYNAHLDQAIEQGDESSPPAPEIALEDEEVDGVENRTSPSTRSGVADEAKGDSVVEDASTSDEVQFMFSINVYERVASFCAFRGGFVVGHDNNTVSVWRFPFDKYLEKLNESLINLCERVNMLDQLGHSSVIKGLTISHDDSMIMSFSHESLKVWNANTHHCTKTIECNNVKSAFFVAGNKYILFGTANGMLKATHLDSCETRELQNTHSDIINIAEHPDHTSFAVVLKNKSIAFYKFTFNNNLDVQELNSLKLSDTPIEVKYTTNGRYVMVSLEDMTVQMYYLDSMKVYLTLYGHKLPITSISSTSDSTLLATCSLDKTIKIWGLDFGNIHKSFLLRDKADTMCQWINDTHYLVSVGFDHIVKIWDCDTFELITQLRGHNRQIKVLAISNNTQFFVIAGDDTTIRLWERTNEQLFITEEQEKELELQLDHELTRTDTNLTIPIDKDNLNNKPIKKTLKSVKATELIMKVIDEADEYKLELTDRMAVDGDRALERMKDSVVALKLFNSTPEEHVINTLNNIDQNIIYEALITLPFLYAEKLLNYIIDVLEKIGCGCSNGLEYVCRIALVVLQIYFRQFSLNSNQHLLITRLRSALPRTLQLEMRLLKADLSYFLQKMHPYIHLQLQERNIRDQVVYNKSILEYWRGMLDMNSTRKRLRD